MNVLLQNPAVLLVLVVIVARFFGRRLMAGKKNPAAAAPPVEDADRTRRVREEVARKIAERRRESLPPVVAQQQAEAPPSRPPVRSSPDADIAEVLARQQKLVDQMRVLEGAEARPKGGFPGVAPAAVPVSNAQADWLRALGDPRSARHAIALREILGAPRGLTLEGCLWR